MWKALLIDADYTHAIRLKKCVDWSSLGISLFVEYNDVCGMEKVQSIKPHILILGRLMFSNAEELAKNLYQQNKQARLILVGSDTQWRNDVCEKLGGYRITESALTAEYFRSLYAQWTCGEEENSDAREEPSAVSSKVCKERLAELISDVGEGQPICLARMIRRAGEKWPSQQQIRDQFIATFGDFFLNFFWESSDRICLILKEPEKISVLYSVQVLGEMMESIIQYLQSSGLQLYPILVSKRTDRMAVYDAYEQTKEMEPFLFFCAQRMVFTATLFQQRRPVEYSEVNRLIDEIALGLLDSNPTNALAAVDEIYQCWLKSSMDFSALEFVHEHLRDAVELVSTVWDREIPETTLQGTVFHSLEEEQQAVHTWITQNCREVEQVQREYGKILQILRFVLKHYGEALSMEGVAQRYQLSPAYFSRQFKKIMGIGFADYVNRVRILEAKALFRAGEHNIERVAKLVGYLDPKYFSRVFKQKMGMSPSSYLAQLQR